MRNDEFLRLFGLIDDKYVGEADEYIEGNMPKSEEYRVEKRRGISPVLIPMTALCTAAVMSAVFIGAWRYAKPDAVIAPADNPDERSIGAESPDEESVSDESDESYESAAAKHVEITEAVGERHVFTTVDGIAADLDAETHFEVWRGHEDYDCEIVLDAFYLADSDGVITRYGVGDVLDVLNLNGVEYPTAVSEAQSVFTLKGDELSLASTHAVIEKFPVKVSDWQEFIKEHTAITNFNFGDRLYMDTEYKNSIQIGSEFIDIINCGTSTYFENENWFIFDKMEVFVNYLDNNFWFNAYSANTDLNS